MTCTSAADCWAVGYVARVPIGGLGPFATLIEHWNGKRWSVVPSPSMGRRSGFGAVSCATSADCWAIGTWMRPHGTGGGTLTEHWNGTAWSLVATPTASSGVPTWIPGSLSSRIVGFGATMNDVSCVRGGACMAVGNGKYDGVPSMGDQLGGSRALTQRWNGTAWADVGTPALAGANITDLLALSCTSGSWCMAVGYSAPRDKASHAMAEQWNGTTWTIVPVPSPFGSTLTGVSCVTPADCWARGMMSGNGSFLAHWNGSRWSM
jgi:hypothetical protein